MNSAILGSSIRIFRRVKTICFLAFTLITLSNKHLSPKGEEVKTKIKKHWTRECARFGEKAKVFAFETAEREKSGHSNFSQDGH